MPRIEIVRAEVQGLLRAVPFRPFALNMENGDRVLIGHPENIAFDPENGDQSPGSPEFHVISRRLRLVSTFNAVTSVAVLDHADS